jgi:hypothetical protein
MLCSPSQSLILTYQRRRRPGLRKLALFRTESPAELTKVEFFPISGNKIKNSVHATQVGLDRREPPLQMCSSVSSEKRLLRLFNEIRRISDETSGFGHCCRCRSECMLLSPLPASVPAGCSELLRSCMPGPRRSGRRPGPSGSRLQGRGSCPEVSFRQLGLPIGTTFVCSI